MTTTAQRSIQRISGRDYRVEVTQVTVERWRAHVINAHGGPTALMPFYATTADLAVTRLTDWLSLAHKQAEKPTAGPGTPAAAGIAASPASANATASGTGVP